MIHHNFQSHRRRSRSGSRDSLNEDKMPLKERKRLDLSSASTTALAGSHLGSPDHSSLRSSPIHNISGLSSSNEECSSKQASNQQTSSNAIVETRRCSSLEGMLNKDDTPALPSHNTASDPKHTSTPVPSQNNDSTGYITMVPVKFDSPSDKHTRYTFSQLHASNSNFDCSHIDSHLRQKRNTKKVTKQYNKITYIIYVYLQPLSTVSQWKSIDCTSQISN